MKKFGVMAVAAVALAACGDSNTIDVLGQKCTKIATGDKGDVVVKCPVNEDLTALRSVAADSMFLSAQVNFEEVAADKENVYVNVIPAGTLEGKGTCYRVVVNEPVFDGEKMYTMQVCEEAAKEEVKKEAKEAK